MKSSQWLTEKNNIILMESKTLKTAGYYWFGPGKITINGPVFVVVLNF